MFWPKNQTLLRRHFTRIWAISSIDQTCRQHGVMRCQKWIGAIAGSATAFVVILLAQVTAANGYWVVELLIIAIPGALFFGISPGGIGGLILGNSWNNNKAAFVGGAIAGITTSFLYISIYIRSL